LNKFSNINPKINKDNILKRATNLQVKGRDYIAHIKLSSMY